MIVTSPPRSQGLDAGRLRLYRHDPGPKCPDELSPVAHVRTDVDAQAAARNELPLETESASPPK